MFWGVLTESDQLRELLEQLGDQRLPLAAGIGPEHRHRGLLCVEQGHEVVIGRSGVPIARLVPLDELYEGLT